MGGRVDFRQRRGKPVRIPADLRAHVVGGVHVWLIAICTSMAASGPV
jgi:hypothetical protein